MTWTQFANLPLVASARVWIDAKLDAANVADLFVAVGVIAGLGVFLAMCIVAMWSLYAKPVKRAACRQWVRLTAWHDRITLKDGPIRYDQRDHGAGIGVWIATALVVGIIGLLIWRCGVVK